MTAAMAQRRQQPTQTAGAPAITTAAEVIAAALALPPLPAAPAPLPHGARCAISGAPIDAGYPLRDLLAASTAVILDVVRGPLGGHLSDAAARCWKNTGPGAVLMRGGLFFEDGTACQPLIALAGRENGRGCWRDALRAVWPARRGMRLVAILTTNTKRRLWPVARVGPLGDATPILLCDGDDERVLTVSWPRLLRCLAVVEAVYALGFAKAAMRDSLLASWRLVEAWTLPTVLALDAALAPWRGTPELAVALLVAQRPHGVVDPPPPPPPPSSSIVSAAPHGAHPADAADARPVQGVLL